MRRRCCSPTLPREEKDSIEQSTGADLDWSKRAKVGLDEIGP